MLKKCNICDVEKSVDNFYKRLNKCKSCMTKKCERCCIMKSKDDFDFRQIKCKTCATFKTCSMCNLEKTKNEFGIKGSKCKSCANSRLCAVCNIYKQGNDFNNGFTKCKTCIIVKNSTKKCCKCLVIKHHDQFDKIKTGYPCKQCMAFKICSKCNINKDASQYGKRCGICNVCTYNIQKKYKESNKERIQKRDIEYYHNNKEKLYATHKKYLENNRDKRNEYIRKYKKERRLNDPSFKIYENLRKRIWKCVNTKSNSSKMLLGCKIQFYTMWIEYTMTRDMNWDNYGTVWHIDHVNPIANFNMLDELDQRKAFNWTNTQALHINENLLKNDKIDKNLIENHKKKVEQFNKIIEFKQNLKWTIRSQASSKEIYLEKDILKKVQRLDKVT